MTVRPTEFAQGKIYEFISITRDLLPLGEPTARRAVFRRGRMWSIRSVAGPSRSRRQKRYSVSTVNAALFCEYLSLAKA